jgi:outer membrane protein TolC
MSSIAKEVTLTEAIRLAKEHSDKLRASEANLASADQAIESARAERYPILSVTSFASYISDIPSLSIAIPQGVSISREMGTHESYQTDARVSVPLFTGGKLSSGIALASASRDMVGATQAQLYTALLAETRLAYISLYKADQQERIARASVARTNALDNDVRSLFEAGAADSVDLLEARLAVANAAIQLEAALTARQLSAIILARLIAYGHPESLHVSDSLPIPSDTHLTRKEEQLPRPELLQIWASIASAKAQRILARADWYPSVVVYGGYSYGKPNLDRFNDRWNDYVTAGVTFNWSFNIGGKTSSIIRRADYAREGFERAERDIRKTIAQEEHLAGAQVVLASRTYTTRTIAMQIAEDRYRLAQIQLHEGTLSTNRLVDIEESLTAAEAEKAFALAEYHLALTRYYYAIRSSNLESGF